MTKCLKIKNVTNSVCKLLHVKIISKFVCFFRELSNNVTAMTNSNYSR